MESDLSSSSSSLLMNTNVKNNNSFLLNDVVAVTNGEAGYILGKVTEQRNDLFVLTVYHYKLGTRTHLFKKEDLIMNFCHAGTKTIYEMSNDQQRVLLNRVHDPDQYSSSLLSLMVEIKKKEEDEKKMLQLIIDLLGELTITENGHELLFKALQENSLNYDEFVEVLCAIAVKEKNDPITNQLADLLAKVTVEKKNLVCIENKMLNDSLAVHFLKKCLWRIGKLIGQSNVDNLDQSFLLFSLHYARLISSHWEP